MALGISRPAASSRSGGDVGEFHQPVGTLVGLELVGPLHDQRYMHSSLIEMRSLQVDAVVAQHLAVVAHENDDGVFQLTGFLQSSDHAANIFVDEFNHRVIGRGDLALVAVGHSGGVIAAGIVVSVLGVELLVGGFAVGLAGVNFG